MRRSAFRRAARCDTLPCLPLGRRYTPTIVDYSSVPLTRETLLSLPGAYLVHSKYSILQQVTLGDDAARSVTAYSCSAAAHGRSL